MKSTKTKKAKITNVIGGYKAEIENTGSVYFSMPEEPLTKFKKRVREYAMLDLKVNVEF